MRPQAVALFVGGVARLPGESRVSAIVKHALAGPVMIGEEGLAGDAQADRRVHGGPEKAVHAYPAVHYATLAGEFPEAATLLVPGSLGENLSLPTASEAEVFLGDVFALGGVRLQLSQPRQPCWKIDARFGVNGMAARIAETGRTGWYFRVLAAAEARHGDELVLLDRAPGAPSLAHFWQTWSAHRPDPAALAALAACDGLNARWRERLLARARALQDLAGRPDATP